MINTKKIIATLAALAIDHAPMSAMKYFTVEEMTASETATRMHIDNSPSHEVIANIHNLVNAVLDPAREQLGKPITVNSGYRCEKLNRAVGGVERSYHLEGRAADITTHSLKDNRRLLEILRRLPHKELIWEQDGSWIHVAL